MSKKYKNTTSYNRTNKDQESSRENPFTRIDQRMVKDERISAEALGYMVYILSQSDKFIINKGQVLRRFGRNPAAKNKAWLQLEELGYIIKKRNGRGCHYTINEVCPQLNEKDATIIDDTINEEFQVKESHIIGQQIVDSQNVSPESPQKVQPPVVNSQNMDTQIVNPLIMVPSDIDITTNNIPTTTKEKTTENIKPNISKSEWKPHFPPPPPLPKP